MSISSINNQVDRTFTSYSFQNKSKTPNSLSSEERSQIATSTNKYFQTSTLIISEDTADKATSAKSKNTSDDTSNDTSYYERLVAEQNLSDQGAILVNEKGFNKQKSMKTNSIDIKV